MLFNQFITILLDFQDSSSQKDGEYMFSQGISTMIHSSIQSLLHSILGDGWLVTQAKHHFYILKKYLFTKWNTG